MEIIAKVSKDIEKEINRAECYVKRALEYKEKYPALAERYFKAATESVANITNNFHPGVVEIIEAYKKEKGQVPEHMQILYNILHKQHIENLAAVKGMLALYKEM